MRFSEILHLVWMNISENKKLYLILEKDYKCLDTVSEDQSDNYENPLSVKR